MCVSCLNCQLLSHWSTYLTSWAKATQVLIAVGVTLVSLLLAGASKHNNPDQDIIRTRKYQDKDIIVLMVSWSNIHSSSIPRQNQVKMPQSPTWDRDSVKCSLGTTLETKTKTSLEYLNTSPLFLSRLWSHFPDCLSPAVNRGLALTPWSFQEVWSVAVESAWNSCSCCLASGMGGASQSTLPQSVFHLSLFRRAPDNGDSTASWLVGKSYPTVVLT